MFRRFFASIGLQAMQKTLEAGTGCLLTNALRFVDCKVMDGFSDLGRTENRANGHGVHAGSIAEFCYTNAGCLAGNSARDERTLIAAPILQQGALVCLA